MITKLTIRKLMNGDMRPGRQYDGEFVASACGRALESKFGRVVAATPERVATTDPAVARVARDAGFRVVRVSAMTRAALQEDLEKAELLSEKRAIRWLLGM